MAGDDVDHFHSYVNFYFLSLYQPLPVLPGSTTDEF